MFTAVEDRGECPALSEKQDCVRSGPVTDQLLLSGLVTSAFIGVIACSRPPCWLRLGANELTRACRQLSCTRYPELNCNRVCPNPGPRGRKTGGELTSLSVCIGEKTTPRLSFRRHSHRMRPAPDTNHDSGTAASGASSVRVQPAAIPRALRLLMPLFQQRALFFTVACHSWWAKHEVLTHSLCVPSPPRPAAGLAVGH